MSKKSLFAPMLIAMTSAMTMTTALGDDGGPISAERPGFSSSPLALAPSVWQVEAGYQYSRDDDVVDVDVSTLPLLLIRVGLAESIEMQVSWTYSWLDAGGFDVDGANDATVGIKWQINDADSTVPLGLFAGLSLPVGASAFSSDDTDPSLGVFWTHSGAADFFGTAIVADTGSRLTLANAVGVGFPIDDTRGAYVELVSAFTEDSGPEHLLNGGMTFLYTRDMQFDVHGGVGLNERAADFFIGFGIARRL